MTTLIHANPDRCIGCRTCELACALEHTTQQQMTPEHFHPRLMVIRSGHISMPVVCHQCENAPCVAACPVQALRMGASSVAIDESHCIGCNSCVVACPFGAIGIEADGEHQPHIIKCDLCEPNPQGPSCVRVCPTHALSILSSELLEKESTQRRSSPGYSRSIPSD